MKIALLSLGCKVNQSEILRMESELRGRGGVELVGLDEGPELCIINTCTVTSKSDSQSRQMARRAAKAGSKVILTGCYAELNPEEARGLKDVVAVVKNSDKDNIINVLFGNTSSNTLISAPPPPISRSRYFLKLQDGCDYSCSYCAVPLARGPSRSVWPQDVIERVRRAVEDGFKEVVLTGIHLGLYGGDLSPMTKLAVIVEEILKKTDVARLRLSSLEVSEVDDRLLGLMKLGRLCRHLHIPLQSGADGLLRLMRRPYTRGQYIERVGRIAADLPGLGLGTDVIVGFPGEGEREFEATLAALEGLPFSYIHVFSYSERPATRAAGLPGKVSPKVKARRSEALRGLSARKREGFLRGLAGLELEVLVEQKGAGGVLAGTADNYAKVLIPSARGLQAGSIVNVRVEGHDGQYAIGELVSGV